MGYCLWTTDHGMPASVRPIRTSCRLATQHPLLLLNGKPVVLLLLLRTISSTNATNSKAIHWGWRVLPKAQRVVNLPPALPQISTYVTAILIKLPSSINNNSFLLQRWRTRNLSMYIQTGLSRRATLSQTPSFLTIFQHLHRHHPSRRLHLRPLRLPPLHLLQLRKHRLLWINIKLYFLHHQRLSGTLCRTRTTVHYNSNLNYSSKSFTFYGDQRG